MDKHIITLYKNKARHLTENSYETYVVDHIIPISKGGSFKPNNLQIITETENLKKGNKIDNNVVGLVYDTGSWIMRNKLTFTGQYLKVYNKTCNTNYLSSDYSIL